MRILEKCVYKTEIARSICDTIGSDRFAYKEGHNTIMLDKLTFIEIIKKTDRKQRKRIINNRIK